jgi:hypothetical protein
MAPQDETVTPFVSTATEVHTPSIYANHTVPATELAPEDVLQFFINFRVLGFKHDGCTREKPRELPWIEHTSEVRIGM